MYLYFQKKDIYKINLKLCGSDLNKKKFLRKDKTGCNRMENTQVFRLVSSKTTQQISCNLESIFPGLCSRYMTYNYFLRLKLFFKNKKKFQIFLTVC